MTRKRRAQFGGMTRESAVCVVCGRRPATTGEHIPPRGLFLRGLEPHLVVPACYQCNSSSKKDDEYFRQIVSAGSWSPEALELWSRKVAAKFPLFPATQAGLRRDLRRMHLEIPKIGRAPISVLLADAARINAVLRKMTFGLFWFHTGHLLSSEIPIEFHGLNLLETMRFVGDSRAMSVFNKAGLGIYRDPMVTRTFFYKVGFTGDLSIWYFVFFGNNMFVVTTGDVKRELGGKGTSAK